MPTHVQMSAKLLRGAADFFRSMKDINKAVADELETNAKTCELVAGLIEKDPHGEAPSLRDGILDEMSQDKN